MKMIEPSTPELLRERNRLCAANIETFHAVKAMAARQARILEIDLELRKRNIRFDRNGDIAASQKDPRVPK